MSEYGKVVNVTVVTLGAVTNTDAPVGATTVVVEDNVDLEVGHAVSITALDGTEVGVNVIMGLTGEDAVTLAIPLPVALPAGAQVALSPLQRETRASVRMASGGDPVRCSVAHGLADTYALVEGIRDETSAETVLVERVGRDLQIVDVVSQGTVRRIIGGYIATADDDEGERLVLRNDGGGGILEAFAGIDDETPGVFNPTADRGRPAITIASGTTPDSPYRATLELKSGPLPGVGGVTAYLNAPNGTASMAATLGVGLYCWDGPITLDASSQDGVQTLSVLFANLGVIVADGTVQITTGGHVLAQGNGSFDGTLTNSGHTTTSTDPNCVITSGGRFYRFVSSDPDLKLVVEPADLTDALKLLDLQPITWIDRTAAEEYADYLTGQVEPGEEPAEGEDPQPVPDPADGLSLRRIPGLDLADVVATGIEPLISRDADGEPAGVLYNRLGVYTLPLVKDLYEQVADLTARIEALEAGS